MAFVEKRVELKSNLNLNYALEILKRLTICKSIYLPKLTTTAKSGQTQLNQVFGLINPPID
jgi:hypothetical protein